MMPTLWTQDEAADWLRVSTKTLQIWRLQGVIPFIRLPRGGVRFDPVALAQWLNSLATTPIKSPTKRVRQIANGVG